MSEWLAVRLVSETHSSPVEPSTPFYSPDEWKGATNSTPDDLDILIVEDDFLIAFELETALKDAGFKVVGVASSADEALSLAAEHSPSIVIMDVHLVGSRDGIDAALDLYNRQGLRCVFATAHSDEETRKRAEAAQPLGWIEKPYSVATVVDVVENLKSNEG